jgi:hypothetical protein
VLSVNDIAVISREQRSTWLDIAVLFTRHFDIDWWPSKRTPTHHHLAIQTSPPPIGQQQDLEDQTCVPVVITTGDSIRLTQATKGKGVRPLAN